MNDILTPRISSTAIRFWRWYFRRSLTSAFFSIHSYGEAGLFRHLNQESQEKIPVIFYATHGGWWDAALAIHFSLNRFQKTTYGLMEYKQLVKYHFFTRIGMMSIVRENPKSALRSIAIAGRLIERTNSLFWIFPQGEIVHQDSKDIEFYPGLTLLLRECKQAYCIPVSMRYDFLQEQRPQAFVRFGQPEFVVWNKENTISDMTNQFRDRLCALANENRSAVLSNNLGDYDMILEGTLSIEKLFDRVKKLLLMDR